jgi:hypothetical protein
MSERAVYHESDLWRNLRRAGIPEAVIMKIGGWRTQSVFERYAIVSRNDIADAMRKLQQSEQTPQIGHVISHVSQNHKSNATSQSRPEHQLTPSPSVN